MLLHLPPMPGHGEGQRVHNGPALAGHGHRSSPRRYSVVDHHPAPTTTPLADLGPGRRNGPTRPAPHRHQPRHLLLRPPKSIATRHQREHQRSPPPILPQPHRPHQTLTHRPRRRRRSPQQPTPQNPRLQDPRRDPQRTSTLPQTRQCCNDPSNPVNICLSVTPTGSPKPASNPQSDPWAIPTITPSPNLSSACTRQNSSDRRDHHRPVQDRTHLDD